MVKRPESAHANSSEALGTYDDVAARCAEHGAHPSL